MVTVITLITSAKAGSRVKIEVAASKLYPLYGHVEIMKPVFLSINENERIPHCVNPSAEPQLLLTLSVNLEI